MREGGASRAVGEGKAVGLSERSERGGGRIEGELTSYPEKKQMSYRWLKIEDLENAIRHQNIMNSRVKRGEIEQPTEYSYVVCGCGDPGCGFMSIRTKDNS